MTPLRRVLTGLFLLTLLACTPEETVRVSPTPTVAPTSVAPATTPARTATVAPATTPPSSPTPPPPTATTSPGSTPNVACPTLSGGSPLATARLTAIRAAHNPGFDRLVFEWTGGVVPEYKVELASTFIATSGQPVRVDGNAFFGVRMVGQAHTDAGARSYAQPDPYRVGLSVVREIKIVEDFEGIVRFGLGMERVVCPTVLTLLGPARIVVDFPSAP
jgi:hypothetical protein